MADSVIYYQDLIGEDDTFKDIFENIEELKKELLGLTKIMQQDLNVVNPNNEKEIEKLTAEIEKLIKAKKELDKQEKKAAKTKKKLKVLTDEELIQREKLKIVNRERVQIAKQNAILQSKETGQIEKLRAKLALTTISWKKLSKEELENTKKGKNLINTKKRLTDQLKKLEKQTGDTRRNVGNYGDSLGKVGKLAARVFVGRSLFDGLRRVGAAFSNLIDKNKDTNKEIGNLDKAIGGFGSAMSNLGVSILSLVAKPLTLLIKGITAVINAFSTPVFKEFSATSDELVKKTEELGKGFTNEKVAAESLFISIKKTTKGSKERKEIIDAINKQYGKYLPNLLTEASNLEEIENAQRKVNQELNRNFRIKIQNATQTDILTNKIEQQNEAFEAFQLAAENANVAVGDELGFAFSQLLDDFSKVGTEGKIASSSLSAYSFRVSAMSDEIRKTNPDLADLVDKFQEVSSAQGRNSAAYNLLKDDIRKASVESGKYNAEIDLTILKTNKLIEGQTDNTTVVNKSTTAIKDNTSAIDSNNAARLKAIKQLQEQLIKAESGNINDLQERAFRLEELRFKAEKEARKESILKIIELQKEQQILVQKQYGKNSQELKDFIIQRDLEIREFGLLNNGLEIAQLNVHEQNKLDIKKDFAVKSNDIESGGQRAARELREKELKEINDAEERKYKVIKQNEEREQESIKKRKKNLEELTDGIIESSKKIGQAIVDIYVKESEIAANLVSEQADSVEKQQKRAEDGLTNTLKFEKDELAKREGERIRAEQTAKNAAKILALYGLVSAYAQSGDTNALQRGLVDFALLTALESAFTGFEDGGFTGSDSSNSKVKGVVHANEYVVTQSDVDKFGLRDKSGTEFGSAMSDYFSEQSPLLSNTYEQQNQQFTSGIKHTNRVDFSRLEHEVRAMRQAFQNQQQNEFDIENMTEYFVDIAKRVTQNRMTTVTKVRKRL